MEMETSGGGRLWRSSMPEPLLAHVSRVAGVHYKSLAVGRELHTGVTDDVPQEIAL